MLDGYGHVVIGGLNDIEVRKGFQVSEWGRINQANFRSATNGWGAYSDLCLGECDDTGSAGVLSFGGTAPSNFVLRFRPRHDGWAHLEYGTGTQSRIGLLSLEVEDAGLWRGLSRTLLPACTSTTGVTWSSPSGLVVRETDEGMSVCDGSE